MPPDMLNHLHINNFAIVPTLDLDIQAGFTAITGETGAGKSILVDALGLLLGERSDAAWVRAGAERAELTAEFSRAFETDFPVEISFWVLAMLVLMVRSVCSATIAELLVRIEDMVFP